MLVASKIKEMIGIYQENYDYIQIGSYQAGSNPKLDEAINAMPYIEKFLRQDRSELATYEDATEKMVAIYNGDHRFQDTGE
jgi:flagellum-specific ATP synthase